MQVLLGELKKGQKARIVSVSDTRLLEMGLLEGAMIEIRHEAPFGGDPIAVAVRGALIALRRDEANQVKVEHE